MDCRTNKSSSMDSRIINSQATSSRRATTHSTNSSKLNPLPTQRMRPSNSRAIPRCQGSRSSHNSRRLNSRPNPLSKPSNNQDSMAFHRHRWRKCSSQLQWECSSHSRTTCSAPASTSARRSSSCGSAPHRAASPALNGLDIWDSGCPARLKPMVARGRRRPSYGSTRSVL